MCLKQYHSILLSQRVFSILYAPFFYVFEEFFIYFWLSTRFFDTRHCRNSFCILFCLPRLLYAVLYSSHIGHPYNWTQAPLCADGHVSSRLSIYLPYRKGKLLAVLKTWFLTSVTEVTVLFCFWTLACAEYKAVHPSLKIGKPVAGEQLMCSTFTLWFAAW